MPLLDNRELVERSRRHKLHAQIGALDAKLDRMGKPATRWQWNKYFRLLNRVRALRVELAAVQMPLL
jgi:hypothetical protein